MACGLGAVALMFIFVKEATYSPLTESFEDEILPLEAQIENIDNLNQIKPFQSAERGGRAIMPLNSCKIR